MHRPALFSLVLLALVVRTGAAQEPGVNLRRDAAPHTVQPTPALSGPPATTPEMWFYEQERNRDDNPKLAIRRRAEQQAAERHARLASMQWFGYSNARPTVTTTPGMGDYSPHWGSNTYDHDRWRTQLAPLVVLRPIVSPY